VHFEYDIRPHLDRVVELVNRTNQLNFTKKRLPEDMEEVIQHLFRRPNVNLSHSALVMVVDKFGDYGYVGFFLVVFSRNGAG
jgi:predicted enzyme involved in methoxymalonyl-ACP biosynthesis